MVNMKKVALYTGILGALASIGTLVLPEKAVSHSSSGNNSPVIRGDGNSVNYQGGFPDLETVRANRPNISDEQYAEIKQGMTYEEVLDIVKIPGRESASLGNAVSYTWGNELYVYMVVTLVDGKVQSKGR